MSELISGKEAMLAWYDNEEVLVRYQDDEWCNLTFPEYGTGVFKSENHTFKLKPKTVRIKSFEIGKPKNIVIDNITGSVGLVYGDIETSKKVAEALRSIFK